MAQIKLSAKHLQITKANTMVVASVAIAAFVTTFSLVASRAILAKRTYQSKVIAEKTKAVDQLEENIEAIKSLNVSYNAFVEQQENIIGGSSAGQGERDGDNAKIVLDALPSSYDFPALTTTLEKILISLNFGDGSITGQDDEIAQNQIENVNLEPVPMPFQISASGSYTSMQDLIRELSLSIRPIQITKLNITGDEEALTIDIDGRTFYQPEKKFNITKKTVE